MLSLSIESNNSLKLIYFLRKFLTRLFVFKETSADEFFENEIIEGESIEKLSAILQSYSKNYKELESDLELLEKEIDSKKRHDFPNKKIELSPMPSPYMITKESGIKQIVIAFFETSSAAQHAVQRLLDSGFTNSKIDLSSIVEDSNTNSVNTNFNNDHHESGVTRFFKNLFGSDDSTDVNRYSTAASRGNSIVTVHTSSADDAEKAADILDENGAINVDKNADDYNNYNTTTSAAPVGAFNEIAGTSAATTNIDTTTGTFDTANKTTSFTQSDVVTGKISIPVIEEELQVGKRTVETGGMRLRSRIIERPVEENLLLREERVYVNRTAVNRVATDADFDSFKEGEIELREHAEVPVVSKKALIVEVVSLGKETNERSETIRDTVRKTEVDVENIEGSTKRTSTTDCDWKNGK